MTVRSQQLGVGTSTTAGGTTTIFTVPAGHRYIIKSVIVFNASSSTENPVRLLITFPTGDFSIYAFPAIPSGSSAVLDLWWVLNAGDNLKIFQNQNALRWTVSGADLVE